MTRTNYFPKNTPESYKDLVDFLVSSYPLQSTQHMIWEFQNRPEVSQGATGRNWNATYEGLKYTTCKVALGFLKSPRPTHKVLHTICHEYCHAMQYDRGEPGDCVKADAFAEQVVPLFLGRVAA